MHLSLAMMFVLFLLSCSAPADEYVINARRVTISSAQQDADTIARSGVLRHCGRNAGMREGIGMGSTPQQAERACCYYGRYRIIDKGIAYSPVRRAWFAVIRYAD